MPVEPVAYLPEGLGVEVPPLRLRPVGDRRRGGVVKARNVSKGDWISVAGKPVKVTKVEAGGYWDLGGWVDDGMHISYKGGSKSGMLRRGSDSQIAHLAGKRGKR